MRHSLAAFLIFLVVGLTIVVLETLFLAAGFDQFQGQIVQNSKMTLSIAQREAALQRFKLNKDAFENKAAFLLSGYTPGTAGHRPRDFRRSFFPWGSNLTTGGVSE